MFIKDIFYNSKNKRKNIMVPNAKLQQRKHQKLLRDFQKMGRKKNNEFKFSLFFLLDSDFDSFNHLKFYSFSSFFLFKYQISFLLLSFNLPSFFNLQSYLMGNTHCCASKFGLITPPNIATSPEELKLFQNAKIFEDRSEYQNAILTYRKIIQINPYSSNSYNGIANCYLKQGDRMRAIQYYNKAIDVDSNNKFAYNGLGVVYESIFNDKQSIQNFKKALEIDPHFGYPYNGLGNFYYARNDFKEASANYEKALELMPKNSLVLLNLASSSLGEGNKEKASLYFKQAIKNDRQNKLNGENKNFLESRIKQFGSLSKINEVEQKKFEELNKETQKKTIYI